MTRRRSGILLHITSLPSEFGIGDLGPSAYEFVDFLEQTKQTVWQILPLNPTLLIYGNCPYSSNSAFAANTLLISPEFLLLEGLLNNQEFLDKPEFSNHNCNFEQVISYKNKILNFAFCRLSTNKKILKEFQDFCSRNSYWLDDYSLFITLKNIFEQKSWDKWPEKIKNRDQKELAEIKRQYANQIEKENFCQFLFFRQWNNLRNYANKRGIKLFGDIPLYVNYDSVDVWRNPEIFKLDQQKLPLFVSGVPPDYFSKTGQRWGMPVYDWENLKKTNYHWWIERFRHNLELFDFVRIDHFRGLVSFWQIPIEETTAINGKWIKAPAIDFLRKLKLRFWHLPIIAEDLGIITTDVKDVMRRFKIPGMRILLFAFGEDNPKHPYLPENYIPNCVAYTGTHDNNTVRGWFENEAKNEEKERVVKYLGKMVDKNTIHIEFIQLLMNSRANLVIIPMQDILGLPESARMNIPGTTTGNWQWRFVSEQITAEIKDLLLTLTKKAKRG